MASWKLLPLLALILGPLFYLLHRFGFMVVKSGTFFGGAMGTPTRFWGEYRRMCGTVSKNFRISPKHTLLTVRVEALSGSAKVEILGPGQVALYAWYVCGSLEKEVGCQGLQTCKVRVSSEDFCGKFDISLQ